MSVNYAEDLLLVTSASGKQASHLLPFLVEKWKNLRLAVNSQGSHEKLEKEYSKAEVIQADLADPKDCQKLLKGATAVYHVGPSFHPHETEIGYNVIDAAKAEPTFKHFVLSSVLNTQLRKLMNHDCKRYVEEYLMESGLNYTILNPSNFTDQFPVQQTLDSGVATIPWSADIRFSHTSLYDLGEVGSIVLGEREKHYLAQYQTVSTMPVSHREQCELAGRILGKDIKPEAMPFEKTMAEDAEKILGMGSDPYTKDGIRRLVLYYNYHGLLGSPNVMRWILGREPMSFEEWLRGKVAASKGKEYELAEARKASKS